MIRPQLMASISARYAGALEEFVRMLERDEPAEQLQRRVRVISELARTWEAIKQERYPEQTIAVLDYDRMIVEGATPRLAGPEFRT